jgi:hypothetical protein
LSACGWLESEAPLMLGSGKWKIDLKCVIVTTGRIIVNTDIWSIFQKLCWENSSFIKINRITGTLHEDQYTFLITSRSILRMRNVWDKSYRENKNILCSIPFFRKSCHLWNDVEKCGRAGQATDDSTAHALCVLDNKATDTHSEYVVLRAFALQQWFRERTSLLCSYVRTLRALFYFVKDSFMWRSCLVCVRQ